MATLKIYNDIASEEDKVFYQYGLGTDAVCMKDIDSFIGAMSKDDEEIDIRLHCNGGLVSEGWAIYDKLRASGKRITATIEGKCASMATVILMAAPKERRKALKSASILVHNPWVAGYCLGEALTAEELRKQAEQMQKEQDKILDLYVERCGCDRAEMQALMDEDKYIDVDKAKEMGIIGEIVLPLSARDNKHKNIVSINMSKVEVKKSWLEQLLAKAGFAKMEDATFGMELSTADGGTVEIEREEGEPQVGDAASPDGEHVMPDGSTIVVEDGHITEIRPAAEDSEEDDDVKGDEKDDEIAELKQKIAELEAENEELKKKAEEASAKAKTKDDMAILNAVKMAGGREWLAKNCSTYKVTVRKVDGVKAKEIADQEEESEMRKRIKELQKK